MNDYLPAHHEDDARYMTWLAVMASQSGGIAELWVGLDDGRVVYALQVVTSEEGNGDA